MIFILLCLLKVLNAQCTCSDLSLESECKQMNCHWINNTCSKPGNGSILTYCGKQQDCSSIFGCALVNGLCQYFTGCTNYMYKTTLECQNISFRCISDGIRCIDLAPCGLLLQSACKLYQKCNWNGYSCTGTNCADASPLFTTDTQCSQYLQGCVSNGMGCVSQLVPCSSYSLINCSKMIGIEGQCSLVNGTCIYQNCSVQQLPCQGTCISNGLNCVSKLSYCNQYPIGCYGYIGLDGQCVSDGSGCVVKTCNLAPENLSTDQDCNTYLQGCITNYQGCVKRLLLCQQYTNCDGKLGLDGICNNLCQPRICSDVNFQSDQQCANYQIGCITNGISCVSQLSLCSTYTINCHQMIGLDGKCKAGPQSCVRRSCSDVTTNCSLYQYNCIEDTLGCQAAMSCPTQQSSTCTSNSCYWTDICVSTTCSNILYYGACTGKCIWDSGICRQKQCNDAGNAMLTNTDCSSFLTGCVWNNGSCIVGTSQCGAYSGNLTTCASYNQGTCWFDSTTVSTCRNRQCSDNTTAITDTECNTFLAQCRTTLNGCIDPSQPCSAYSGPNCAQFKGTLLNIPCFNTLSGVCRNRQCADDITSTTNSQCNQSLQGCLTNGQGCIDPTQSCSAYYGTQSQCMNFIGNGVPCTNIVSATSTTNCINRQCSQIQSTYTITCSEYLPNCISNGTICIDSTLQCSTYSGTYSQCIQIFTNNQTCNYHGQCSSRQCSEVVNPQNQSSCDSYLSNCFFINGHCYQIGSCTSYPGTSITQCLTYKNATQVNCWWLGGSFCVDRVCSMSPIPSTQLDCSSFMSSCTISYPSSGNICVPIGSCSTYQGTATQCASLYDSSQNRCKAMLPTTQYCTLQPCASYTGTTSQCQLYKGTDGYCWSTAISTSPPQNCITRQCSYKTYATNLSDCQIFNNCFINYTSATNAYCVNSGNTCSSYTMYAYQCQQITGSDGACWSLKSNTANPAACLLKSAITCAQITGPVGLSDCQVLNPSCLIQQNVSGILQCVDPAPCTTIQATPEFCSSGSIFGSDGMCYLDPSAVSGVVSSCLLRTCNLIPTTPAFESECRQFLSTCTLNEPTAGTYECVNVSTCSSYTGDTSLCQSKIGTDGPCWSLQLISDPPQNCILRNCSHKLNPSILDCDAFLNGCVFSYTATGTKCMTQGPCSTYYGTQSQCSRFLGTDGKCWNTSISASNCQPRSCSQLIPSQSIDCSAFLNTCRQSLNASMSLICIPQGSCNTYYGTQSQCSSYAATDAPCWQLSTGWCYTKQCIHNTTAINDAQCQAFLSGCKTNGMGCIPQSTTCASLSGSYGFCSFVSDTNGVDKCTINPTLSSSCIDRQCTDNTWSITDQDCQLFMSGCVTTGLGCILITAPCSAYPNIKCNTVSIGCASSVNSTTCRNRVCTDNITSTTDAECQLFLAGCVTNSRGCLPNTSPCSAYVGSMLQCSVFRNNSCYQLPSMVANCINRECTQFASASDVLCKQFMSTCVTNGVNCVTQQNCNLFIGDENACSNFTALDGPCKSVNGICQKRLCYEASYNYTTDAQCTLYHPDCRTNGRGCTSGVDCNQHYNCQSSSCQIVKSCTVGNSCPQITNAYQCVQNIKCSWRNNNCHESKCSDLLFTTNKQCSVLEKCTINGVQCVDALQCSSYDEATCNNGLNINNLACAWTGTECRDIQCTDMHQAQKDSDCNTFLTGCKWNGFSGCINPTSYNCSDFGSASYCIQDSSNNPCLWIDKCYSYQSCQSISGTTHAYCYKINCTSNGANCIPLDLCQNYTTQISCVIGSDKSTCAWNNQLNTCSAFISCQLGIIQTYSGCQLYNPKCVSNGTTCINYPASCSALNQDSCHYNSAQKSCYWNGSHCTDLICQYKQLQNYTACQVFSPLCTSDGTQCISIQNCSTYPNAISCYKGTDGVFDKMCIFDKTKNRCRIKQCTDFSQQNCPNNCIYNGSQCINMQVCANYTNKTNCLTGFDGICIYSNQKCSLAQSCELLKINQCLTYSACRITNSVCGSQTCASMQIGTICNPFKYLNGTTQICVLQNGSCVPGDSSQLASNNCLVGSNYAYRWLNQSCQQCVNTSILSNNTIPTNVVYSTIVTMMYLIY